MPLTDDAASLDEMGQGGGGSVGMGKWLLIGGLGLIVVFFFLKKKGSSGSSSSGQQVGSQNNVDPSTGFPVGSSADVAALRTYGALGGGGRYNEGKYPTAKGGPVSSVGGIGLGGAYQAPYEPVNSAWINGLAEPSFPVGPAGQPGAGNFGATGMNTADITSASTALTVQSTVPINDKSANHTRVYRVKPGDNLAGIAAEFGVAGGTTSLYRLNQHHIGPNPDMLIPGTLIYL